MTISTTHAYKQYTGNGSTTEFPVDFQFFDAAELLVVLVESDGTETLQTIATHYTVAGGAGSTGTVTMLTPPAGPAGLAPAEKLRIERATAMTQGSSWDNLGRFNETSLNRALDRRELRVQDLELKAARAVKQTLTDYDSLGAEISLPAPDAGKFLGWSDDADAIVNLDGISIEDFPELTSMSITGNDKIALWDDSEDENAAITVSGFLTYIDEQLGISAGAAPDSIGNVELSNMPAWSIKLRNAGTSGDPTDAAVGDLTSEASPQATDYVFGFLSTGAIVKYPVSALVSVGLAEVASDPSPQLGGDLDTNGFDIIVADGDVISAGHDVNEALAIGAWDVDGAAFVPFFTLTSANTPTGDLASGVTIGGAAIYRASGTDVALADGGTGASLVDPNADRIMFWDDSAGAVAWLDPANGIAVSDTSLGLDIDALSAASAFESGDKLVIYEAGVGIRKIDFDDLPGGTVNVVDDTSPQLGGDLDTNSFNIAFDDAHGIVDENGNEQLIFQTTASAEVYVEIQNAASGNPALISAKGETNANLEIHGNGTGGVIATFTNTGLHLHDTDASHDLIVAPGSNLTADRTLTIITGDADRSLTIGASSSIAGTAYVGGGTDVALADGGTGASLSDPNADRLLFWDDSAGAVTWLAPTGGIEVDGTNLQLGVGALSAPSSFGSGDKIIIFEGGVAKVIDYDDLPGAGAGLSNVVEDTTPQLGGDLDANAFDILFDDGTGIRDENDNEQLIFQTAASAVNYVEISNAATGQAPSIAARGETDVDLVLTGNGTGGVLATFTNEGLHILDTDASHDLVIKAGSDLSADRILTIVTGDAARTLTLTGNGTVDQDVSSTGSPTFADPSVSSTLTVPNTGLHLLDTGGDHDLIVKPGSNLTADRTLTVTTGDADRTLTVGADSSISGTAYVVGGTDVAIADGGTGASTAATAFGNLKQAATTSATGVVELATSAELRSAAAGTLVVTAAELETAAAFVSLTETGGAVALDWDSFFNGAVTIDENTTISNPTNGQPGTSRRVYVIGNNTTDRTVTFGNQFLGELPVITDCDSGRAYLLTIICITASHFVVSAKRATG